jgi:hypothetical protein
MDSTTDGGERIAQTTDLAASAPTHPVPGNGRLPGRARSAFAAALAALLALLFLVANPNHVGDVEEYALMTVALAQHASPDIRPTDIATASAQLPPYAASLDLLAQGMGQPGEMPKPGYYRGHDGRTYAIHFFAYPALAVPAYKALALCGADPFKCFLAVNLAFVFVLGLALRRLLGSNGRAAFGVLLFLLCGGYLYGNWSSPETMSAAALLAALALYATGAPLTAGLLAGLAAMHNPPIVFFAAFAPLLRLCLVWQRGASLATNLRRALGPRELAGSILAATLFALPLLFNQWAFGVPSIIARVSTSNELATANRLFSFFFDLNQGMLVGVPGLFAALLATRWRGRGAALCALCLLFTVALAAPALVAHNWNSGSAGMMRYAFWGAMPLLFALLWSLHGRARWPVPLLAALVALQLASLAHARRYTPNEFSPLAKWVLAHAPGAYNPDPEIFHERTVLAETRLDPQQVDSYVVDGVVVKRMFNLDNSGPKELCGPGFEVAADAPVVPADRRWRYINGNGAVPCAPVTNLAVGAPGLLLREGWSTVEHLGGMWDGVWSDSARARLTIAVGPGQRPTHLTLHGRYYDGNQRTRVTLDGVDLGWQRLDQYPSLPVPPAKGQARTLEVALQFDAPHVPPPTEPEQRRLAYFLQKVTMR